MAVQAWVPIDGSYDLGAGPRQAPQIQEQRYPLSNCISCTICMEVCPQFNEQTGFVGAATIAQVKLFNNNPTGAVLKAERLRALAEQSGLDPAFTAAFLRFIVSEVIRPHERLAAELQ